MNLYIQPNCRHSNLQTWTLTEKKGVFFSLPRVQHIEYGCVRNTAKPVETIPYTSSLKVSPLCGFMLFDTVIGMWSCGPVTVIPNLSFGVGRSNSWNWPPECFVEFFWGEPTTWCPNGQGANRAGEFLITVHVNIRKNVFNRFHHFAPQSPKR